MKISDQERKSWIFVFVVFLLGLLLFFLSGTEIGIILGSPALLAQALVKNIFGFSKGESAVNFLIFGAGYFLTLAVLLVLLFLSTSEKYIKSVALRSIFTGISLALVLWPVMLTIIPQFSFKSSIDILKSFFGAIIFFSIACSIFFTIINNRKKVMKRNKWKVMLSFIFTLVLAQNALAEWSVGSLHQHTGYSTLFGISDQTSADNCGTLIPPTEGHFFGLGVNDLARNAQALNLDFFLLSDHSYCINSTEFDIVEQECNALSSLTCLMGEELSVSDVSEDSTIHTNSIDIIPNNIFDGNFTVGNKANLNITFNYYYQGNLYRVYKNTTMEIVE